MITERKVEDGDGQTGTLVSKERECESERVNEWVSEWMDESEDTVKKSTEIKLSNNQTVKSLKIYNSLWP